MQPTRSADAEPAALALEQYLPYRLSVITNTVSRALARFYQREFGISVGEWRVLAVLARFGPLTSSGVVQRTAMDKVQVSRAVSRAAQRGLVERSVDAGDRRRTVLQLTRAGREVHRRVAPHALALQRHLLSVLSGEERRALDGILAKLLDRARSLNAPPQP